MPPSQVVPDTVPVRKAHMAPHRKNFGKAQSFVVKQQVSAFPPLFIYHVLSPLHCYHPFHNSGELLSQRGDKKNSPSLMENKGQKNKEPRRSGSQ